MLLAMQMKYIAFSWDIINANSTVPSFPLFFPALSFLFAAYFRTLFSFSEIIICLANNLLITLIIWNVILRRQSSRNISTEGMEMNSIFKNNELQIKFVQPFTESYFSICTKQSRLSAKCLLYWLYKIHYVFFFFILHHLGGRLVERAVHLFMVLATSSALLSKCLKLTDCMLLN